MDELRDYQQKAVDEVRNLYSRGVKKVLIHLSTGGGKTHIFCYVLNSLTQKSNKKAIMIVRGKELVNQASRRLIENSVEHGVIMASHWLRRVDAKIQICSIDTLASWHKKGKPLPVADLVVIDEAHLAVSKSFRDVLALYPEAFYLPVTATPHIKKGLRHIADAVVRPITFSELVANGNLVPPRYYCPTKIDLKRCRVKDDEYVTADVEEELERAAILGDVVRCYREHLDGKPAIVFAVSVNHSKKICENFSEAGIRAEHVDANTKDKRRLEIINGMTAGEIKIIVNVGVFCTGLDIPCLAGVIMVRPTKSYNLYVQQIGRGTRPYHGKKDFLVLDHVGNIMEHGLVENEMECLLDGWEGEPKTKNNLVTCMACYAVFAPIEKSYVCPVCGHDNKELSEGIIKREDEEDDDLVELTDEQKLDLFYKQEVKSLKRIRVSKKYKAGWVFFAFRAKYGSDLAAKYVKKRVVPEWVQLKNTKKF
jgi:DNA repair protein RadD